MKRDFSKLTKEDKIRIKKWFQGDPMECPFRTIKSCQDICISLFPNLLCPPLFRCPCCKYGSKYVRHVISKAIKEGKI